MSSWSDPDGCGAQSVGDELPFYATADSMTIAEAERVAVALARYPAWQRCR